jgi:hypothetical protein
MNRTELYQLCRHAELPVQPNWYRAAYIEALLGKEFVVEPNALDELRVNLITFITEFWSNLQAQLKCPAKNIRNPDPAKVDAKPCYRCVDMQVSACWSELSPDHQQRLTQLRRK